MTAALKYISPFDAASRVTFDLPECKSARANRFGIGYGQRGFWGNQHFADIESATVALDARLADVRKVYGAEGRGQTGRFIEEEMEIKDGVRLIRWIRFVPLLKSGKRGKTIHTIHLYPIDVSEGEIVSLSRSLNIPVR